MIVEELITAKIGFIASGVLAAISGVMFALTDAVAISIVTSCSAVLMAAVAAYFSYKAKTISDITHTAVNSRMDEFKKMAEQMFRAEGVQQERAEEAGRAASHAEGVLQQKNAEQEKQRVIADFSKTK